MYDKATQQKNSIEKCASNRQLGSCKPYPVMRRRSCLAPSLLLLSAHLLLSGPARAQEDPGFIRLFDGKSLDGWTLVDKRDEGYGVKNGVIYCARGGGGNLFTKREFSDFVLRFEFKLEDGSNNGVGIRAPLQGRASTLGMEIQILDEKPALEGKWGKLKDTQFHGSIYDVVPAKKGALRPVGEWNTEEITARGRQIKVVLNGQTVVDANLNTITDPQTLEKHPGILRDRGHIGLSRSQRLCRVPQYPAERTPRCPGGQHAARGIHRALQRQGLDRLERAAGGALR